MKIKVHMDYIATTDLFQPSDLWCYWTINIVLEYGDSVSIYMSNRDTRPTKRQIRKAIKKAKKGDKKVVNYAH